MEKLISLKLPPGVRSNGTGYQAKGRYSDANLTRFYQDTIRPVGGWAARSLLGATITGTVRAVAQYTPEIAGTNQQPPVLAIATTTGLYVIVEGECSDITPSGLGTDADRMWSLDVFGSYLVAVATSRTNYLNSKKMYVWTGVPADPAVQITGAPASPTAVGVTDERFLLCLGGVDVLGPNYTNFPTVPSTRTVFWATRETYTEWTPTAANSAGSYPLATEGKLLCSRRSRGQTLLFTTTDVHAMQYIGGEFIYRFQQVGDKCGAISMNSPVVVDGAAFWMGTRGFFRFDGFVQPIPGEVDDLVFGQLNRTYAHLVWGFANPTYGEVTWFYPSGAATECDRYVTYNFRENHWTVGALARAAGVSAQPPGVVPVLVTAAGVVYDHETGTTMPGGTTPFLESGPVELGDGDRVFNVSSIVPDEKTLGDVTVTFTASMYPNGATTSHGPYTLAVKTDVRLTARQVRVKYTQAVASDWRVGDVRLGVIPQGFR